jgi:hypothetical protein
VVFELPAAKIPPPKPPRIKLGCGHQGVLLPAKNDRKFTEEDDLDSGALAAYCPAPDSPEVNAYNHLNVDGCTF